ncbi:MAG TPA: YraN family protein [Promicromonospora sp.]|nr:YraN family protein [Promicromonospora sp.]
MAKKDGVGRYGEQVARRHLEERGWTVLDTNWRGADGELDIVAVDGDVLVVVEVKTRSGHGYGHPAEAVTARKLARVKRLTGQWLTAFRERAAAARLAGDGAEVRTAFGAVRIDVVAVTLPRRGAAVVEHLEAVA